MAVQQEGEALGADRQTTRPESISGEMWPHQTRRNLVCLRFPVDLSVEPQTISAHDGRTDTG